MKQTCLAIAILLLTGLVWAGDSQPPVKKMWAKSVLGQKAPKFTAAEWITPEPKREGKFVLIDFWATWCGPCRKAVSKLNQWQKKYGDKLVIIGVSDEPAKKIRDFSSPKPEYALVVDPAATMKKELQVTGIPHIIIVDPQGIVRWEGFPFLGNHELTDAAIEEILAK